jgi:hypothetical protein
METEMISTRKEIRRAMWSTGCSGALYSVLNREFGFPKDAEERASSALCGGIMPLGQQCGMLWGSSMAAGAESLRRSSDLNHAIELAVSTTRKLMESYSERAKCINCRDFTRCDFSRPGHRYKYMLTRSRACFRLLYGWVPEAVESAREGLSRDLNGDPRKFLSCASVVAGKMGASEEEMITVSGFAGGMGLSGNGCGALAAAIWIKSLDWIRNKGNKNAYYLPAAKKTIQAFGEKTGKEFLCYKICGKRFNNLEEHSEFIENGGCKELIDLLAQS